MPSDEKQPGSQGEQSSDDLPTRVNPVVPASSFVIARREYIDPAVLATNRREAFWSPKMTQHLQLYSCEADDLKLLPTHLMTSLPMPSIILDTDGTTTLVINKTPHSVVDIITTGYSFLYVCQPMGEGGEVSVAKTIYTPHQLLENDLYRNQFIDRLAQQAEATYGTSYNPTSHLVDVFFSYFEFAYPEFSADTIQILNTRFSLAIQKKGLDLGQIEDTAYARQHAQEIIQTVKEDMNDFTAHDPQAQILLNGVINLERALLREAIVLAYLAKNGVQYIQHPRGLAVDEKTGEIYLLLPWLEGENAHSFMQNNQTTLGQRLQWFARIIHTISQAHTLGIAHGDLKETNCFIDPEGNLVAVLDLNNTYRKDDPKGDYPKKVGTEGYAAPELYEDEVVNPASDVFALGVMLHNLCIGSGTEMPPVFANNSPFLDVLQRAMAKDPTQRFQNASEMMEALRTTAFNPFLNISS